MALGAQAVQESGSRAETDDRPGREFEAVYREMLPRIYGYILVRVGHDVGLAEDLTQETMLAYARAQGDGVAIANPTAWLFGTARFKVIDHYRSHATGWAEQIPDGEIGEGASDGAAELERVIDRARLVDALNRLPAPQRLAILLRYTDGFSLRETAALLGKSEHATESLLLRGRRALRQLLSEGETRP
jgi:RNA polymerase sigma-70 factor (ECF subfamily)